jgi:hypothetical protein
MSSQSTSSGIKTFVPSNRDPRYIRPTYTCPDISNDSILINDTGILNNSKLTCTLCNKVFNSNKGLKLHTTRIHPNPIALTNPVNSIPPNTDNVDVTSQRSSPLEQAYGHTLSTSIDENDLWYKRWKKICGLTGKQYNLPNGNIPIHFITLLTKEVESLSKKEFPSERLLVYVLVMLQRDKQVRRAKDIRILLNQRLLMWEAGEVDLLIDDAICSDKKLCKISKSIDSDLETVKLFNRLMMRGKLRDAMNC